MKTNSSCVDSQHVAGYTIADSAVVIQNNGQRFIQAEAEFWIDRKCRNVHKATVAERWCGTKPGSLFAFGEMDDARTNFVDDCWEIRLIRLEICPSLA
ncbi:hypothetical protein BLNAU_3874 [Blattamonas nauphoetae]|uniref:Uncharacterized protein n=1 Tax=Blattamonas nauphoetae TaxID=2049346 RepID=A0ABQ9YBF6_9EUKA|nr:hypothetical protein BLNAU_3874 [Blattamonas nauphoetae]